MDNRFKKWIKKVGWAGLAFFTLKGIVWLVIFYFGIETFDACTQK